MIEGLHTMRGVEAKNTRPRGFDILRRVYDELYTHLNDEFSPAELLLAAQTLIDVTNAEYVDSNLDNNQHHYGYFSYPVDTIMTKSPW